MSAAKLQQAFVRVKQGKSIVPRTCKFGETCKYRGTTCRKVHPEDELHLPHHPATGAVGSGNNNNNTSDCDVDDVQCTNLGSPVLPPLDIAHIRRAFTSSVAPLTAVGDDVTAAASDTQSSDAEIDLTSVHTLLQPATVKHGR
uniref:Zinc finger A20 and AN1 domain-containing stress-associated protein 9 n=1 Tax=Lygus hesperus TaxID=30085 RepID=A0A0A9WID0_LYGHE